MSKTLHGLEKRYKSTEKPSLRNSSVQILQEIIDDFSQGTKQKPTIK